MNNILSILTGIAMIGASALALEGVNKATNGNFYLASVKYLAEASPSVPDSGFSAPTSISPQSSAMPPSSSGGSGGFNQQPPMMPFSPSGERSSNSSGSNFNSFEPPTMAPSIGGQNQIPLPMEKNQSGSQTSKSFFDFFGGGQRSSGNQQQIQQMMGRNQQGQNGQPGQSQNNQPRSNQQGQSQQGFGPKSMQNMQSSKSGESSNGSSVQKQSQSQSEEESGHNVDPRQVQQSLNDINRFRTEVKNVTRQVRKQASAADLAELSQIQAEVDKIYSTIANGSDSGDIGEAVQSFYESEYWDKINNVRTRVQIPQELKRFQQSFKRVDKILQVKATQNLGLNIDKARQAVASMKQIADNVQSQYASGSYDDAGEGMRDLQDNGQPGDIESTVARVRDIKSTLKRVRDTEVRAEAEGVLQEVVDKFNNGEYRDARETLDEYSDDLMNLLGQFARAKNLNRSTSKNQIQNLGNLIEKKLQEIDVKQGQSQESSSDFNQ